MGKKLGRKRWMRVVVGALEMEQEGGKKRIRDRDRRVGSLAKGELGIMQASKRSLSLVATERVDKDNQVALASNL